MYDQDDRYGERLQLQTGSSEGRSTIICEGELDTESIGTLAAAVEAAAATDVRRIEIDLAGVTFIDAACLGALVHWRDEARRADKWLVVTDVSDAVDRLFEITGLRTLRRAFDG